jgi:hypothetical protein
MGTIYNRPKSGYNSGTDLRSADKQEDDEAIEMGKFKR